MSVEVILEGVLGKKFGSHWDLHVTSPAEALRMIEANRPGIAAWIRKNQDIYSSYRVTCEYANGQKEDLCDDDYLLNRGSLVRIVFEIVLAGAGGKGGVLQTIVGAVLIVVGLVITGGTFGAGAPFGSALIMLGVSMMVGGVIQMLTPQPKLDRDDTSTGNGKKNSNYFDGPANTTNQGNPVPLCYGTVLAGSQAASANLVIDQVL